MKLNKDNDALEEAKILCPFCNVVWTAEMSAELDSISKGCDTCGYGGGATVTLRITCSNCHRVVYAKETRAH